MLVNVTDQELVRRCRSGCSQSFPELVRRYHAPLLHFLTLRARRHADAEDLLQESFLRAFRKLHQYRERWAFKSWIFTIASRTFISVTRSTASRRMSSVDARAVGYRACGLLKQVEEQEWQQRLWETAGRVLSEEQYQCVRLRYVDGLSSIDMARILNRSSVAIRTILCRARRQLAPHMAPYDAVVHSGPDVVWCVSAAGRSTGTPPIGRQSQRRGPLRITGRERQRDQLPPVTLAFAGGQALANAQEPLDMKG